MPFINQSLDPDVAAKKIILNEHELKLSVLACRQLGAKVVLTIGSWDMLHIGHVRYLIKAQSHGNILVVGVDSDRAVKKYKGEFRPIIPELERREMLCYLSCVDFITTVDDVDDNGKWQYRLLKLLNPEVFVAVEDSYPEEQCAEIRRHATDLVVLPRQAENTSSTQIIQTLIKGNPDIVRQIMETKS